MTLLIGVIAGFCLVFFLLLLFVLGQSVKHKKYKLVKTVVNKWHMMKKIKTTHKYI